jgi:DNA-binding transcriptional regulator YiaG
VRFALTGRGALCTLANMSAEIDIKSLRDKFGWTQEQLAEYLGLDRSSVSRMETGQAPKGPTLKLLEKLREPPHDQEAPEPRAAQR